MVSVVQLNPTVELWVNMMRAHVCVESPISDTCRRSTANNVIFQIMLEAWDMVTIVACDLLLIFVLEYQGTDLLSFKTAESSVDSWHRIDRSSPCRSKDYSIADLVANVVAWRMLIDNAELLVVVWCSRSRRKRTLLLKFSFPTSLLHVWERAVREGSPESLPFLAI